MPSPVAIATIESISGTVYARSSNGALRELSVGDQLFDGEVLVSQNGGFAALELIDGQQLSSQGIDELGMSRELLVSEAGVAQEESALAGDSPQALIEALANNQDLSELLEATAAGPGGGNAANSGFDFVQLGRVAEAVGELFAGAGERTEGVDSTDGAPFSLDDNDEPLLFSEPEVPAEPITPVLSVADVEIVEPVSGASIVTFTVTLASAPTDATGIVTVDYSTANLTAQSGLDYLATQGTLEFAVGETEKTVSVTVINEDDSDGKGDEQFALEFSNLSGNAEFAEGSHLGADGIRAVATIMSDASSSEGYTIIGSGAEDVIYGQAGDDYLKGKGSSDQIEGGSGEDTLLGNGGQDTLIGGQGHDTLKGGNGHDHLDGGADNDSLIGGKGNDTLIGGAGDDVLKGNAGADTFAWELGDAGTVDNAAADTIKDFQAGDVLDLKDLLIDEENGDLNDYLNFVDAGSDTLIEISTTGALGDNPAAVDQTILLKGVEMGVDLSDTSAQIISDMMNGSLVVTE